ncbi:PAN domain-containing protein [Nitratireductor sp. XY-223]|uniref:PAN domain-containing protein n=1 Tax=Nitratireductor sp. XY-223 TaxID=2561926 RepID=UPI0019818E5D|nr:PAN domain-containing protein [Nitratireductor sp. XY-223]
MFKGWMRCLAITSVILAGLSGHAGARDTFVLWKVFEITDNKNMPVAWDRRGSDFEAGFSIRYRSDKCIGSYRVRFTLDRDVRELHEGEEFAIRIRKLSGRPPCGHKWTSATVFSANNILASTSSQYPSDYETNSNIGTIQAGSVKLWPDNKSEATVILKAEAKKDVPYTAFAMNVGHSSAFSRLVFLYRYSKAEDTSLPAGMEQGIDRPGQDYRNFEQAYADPNICWAACTDESRCRAWTWVRPGVQGPRSVCWLKHSVPPARRSDCCVSGSKLVK